MPKTKFIALFSFMLALFIYSCFWIDKPGGSAGKNSVYEKEDTLSNEIQCSVSINDKQFVIPADRVRAGYIVSDSSLLVTIKGLETGRLVITIPNPFKGPCKIPTGFSSVRTKVSGSDEPVLWPTVDLYNYDTAGTNFNSLINGKHKNIYTDDAVEITSIYKVAEDIPNNWTAYLLKGKIHTTVFKSRDESSATENNKEYTVKGEFVIQPKIYF